MQDFVGKVAVITGAASGIGRGIAERCASEGMKVVLAGINQDNLDPVEAELKNRGIDVISVQADVSNREDIQKLAETTLKKFGGLHLLVNNAGVGAGTTIWESSWNDWEWVLDVNLWGVIHGLKIFLPIMLEQGSEGHIVNVSSVAGMLPRHISAPYMVSKHAVVALSEQLYYALSARGSNLRVSVLCPGWVKTRILESERNRPGEIQDPAARHPATPQAEASFQEMVAALEAGITPEEVANQVFTAIQEEKLYILTHEEYKTVMEVVYHCRVSGINPPLNL